MVEVSKTHVLLKMVYQTLDLYLYTLSQWIINNRHKYKNIGGQAF